ncbi:MAG TPA: Clp protease N-terminal domain-containing protein [Acidimicrobiales bacterium]|nr:Clp protease N-terminal domain-containing protein [Acidimicrobiales bacterium]
MFERFTDRARRVLVLAQEEARLLNHNFIGSEHILLGLISEGEGVAAQALGSMGIALESVRTSVGEIVRPGASSTAASPPFTPRAKKVLELSLREAMQLGHNYIGTEHMLLGLVREGEGVAAQVLTTLGADTSRVRQRVIEVLSGAPFPEPYGIDPEAVTPAELPADPSAFVTWEDVEAVLRAQPHVDGAESRELHADPITYRTCTYSVRAPASVSVSLIGANVPRQAFDSFSEGREWAKIDGLGDAATFDPATRSLRVLTGSTLFVVSVKGHDDPLAAATALARKALDRLGEGSSGTQ